MTPTGKAAGHSANANAKTRAITRPSTRPSKLADRGAAGPQQNEGERLSKRVMQLKDCSRREAELYIEGGWVKVGGVVVEDPPFRVTHQSVSIDSAATLIGTDAITLILNKPPGWIDGVDSDADDDGDGDLDGNLYDKPHSDKQAHPPKRERAPAAKPRASAVKSARALLTAANHWTQDPSGVRVLKRHFSHLDAEIPLETGASGLVVFTQDWRTTRKLREDMAAMEHELVADVTGEVPPEALQKIARALHDTRTPLPHTKFSVNSSTPERSKLRFAIKGAHPGLVAYLCDKAGLELLALRRIRLGRVALSDLPPGQWRYLAELEKF